MEIIDGNKESIDKFHERGWGAETITVTKEHIDALLSGKALGIDDGEYTHVLVMEVGD